MPRERAARSQVGLDGRQLECEPLRGLLRARRGLRRGRDERERLGEVQALRAGTEREERRERGLVNVGEGIEQALEFAAIVSPPWRAEDDRRLPMPSRV